MLRSFLVAKNGSCSQTSSKWLGHGEHVRSSLIFRLILQKKKKNVFTHLARIRKSERVSPQGACAAKTALHLVHNQQRANAIARFTHMAQKLRRGAVHSTLAKKNVPSKPKPNSAFSFYLSLNGLQHDSTNIFVHGRVKGRHIVQINKSLLIRSKVDERTKLFSVLGLLRDGQSSRGSAVKSLFERHNLRFGGTNFEATLASKLDSSFRGLRS
jgi:hypothetical protein